MSSTGAANEATSGSTPGHAPGRLKGLPGPLAAVLTAFGNHPGPNYSDSLPRSWPSFLPDLVPATAVALKPACSWPVEKPGTDGSNPDQFGAHAHSGAKWSQYERCCVCRAMDRDGQGLVRLEQDHSIGWIVGRAKQWLADYFPGFDHEPGRQLPPQVRRWLKQPGRNAQSSAEASSFDVRRGNKRLRIWRVEEGDVHSQVWLLLREETIDPALVLRDMGFTARETDILRWVVEGKSNPEIGIILQTSRHTVRKHVEHILAKLRVESRVGAVIRIRELLHAG